MLKLMLWEHYVKLMLWEHYVETNVQHYVHVILKLMLWEQCWWEHNVMGTLC